MTLRRIFKTFTLALFVLMALWTSPQAGAQGLEQAQMKAIAGLTRLAFGCAASTSPDGAWVLAPPSHDQLDTNGSPNQRMLARAWYYGWALRPESGATTTQKNEARTLVQQYLDIQSRSVAGFGGPFGHYFDNGGATRNEEMTSSHYQLWAAAITGAYVFALGNGGSVTASSVTSTPETAIRDSARRWWADEKRLYDLISRPKGSNLEIDSPGARFTSLAGLGTNALRDDLYRLLRDKAPNKVETCSFFKDASSSFSMNTMKGQGIVLSAQLGTALSGETAAPQLWDTMCTYILGSDWALYFPKMREVLNPLFWVQSIGGAKAYSEPHFGGFDTSMLPTTKPQNMTGATVRTILGLGAGASSCPTGAQLQTFTP
ncbi:MAG: hypothetical protein ABJC13_00195 [Acidobacteriota bacterium]